MQTAGALNAATSPPTAAPQVLSPREVIAQFLATAGDAASPQASSSAAHFDDSPIASQVVRGLSAMINQRGGVMRMQLDPPELGSLRVQMTIARGVVAAEFQASSQQAHGLLEKNLAALRSALESQGLVVDRLTVHVAPGAGQQGLRDDGNSNQAGTQQHRQSHDAAGGESRGRREHEERNPASRFAAADFNSVFGAADFARASQEPEP